jgi:hypothetical protein
VDDAGMFRLHLPRTLTLSLVAVLVTAAAACGSDSKAASSTQSSGGTSTSSSTTTTTVVESIAASSASDDAQPMPQQTALQGGVRYKVTDARVPVDVTFKAVDGGYGISPGALFSHSLDEAGNEPLVSSFYLEQARTFTQVDPPVDERTNFIAVTEPAKGDYLAYISSNPAFTVGPIQDTTVDGRPARSMHFEMSAAEGSTTTCGRPGITCVAVTYFTSGITVIYAPGESGTLYQFDVDGHTVVVDVADRPQAPAVLASLHYTKRT